MYAFLYPESVFEFGGELIGELKGGWHSPGLVIPLYQYVVPKNRVLHLQYVHITAKPLGTTGDLVVIWELWSPNNVRIVRLAEISVPYNISPPSQIRTIPVNIIVPADYKLSLIYASSLNQNAWVEWSFTGILYEIFRV